MKHILGPACVSISILVLEMERNRWARIVILFWPVTKYIGSEVPLNMIVLTLWHWNFV
jgi:hypothetical protein